MRGPRGRWLGKGKRRVYTGGMLVIARDVEETLRLGRLLGRLAPLPPETMCIALEGELGAGKTHLTRGIAEGAAVEDPALVSSPTYVLLNVYPGRKPVYHLDAYRIESEEDFEGGGVGFEELLGGGGIVVVEWASRVAHLLPEDRVEVAIEHGEETERIFRIEGTGVRSRRLVEELEAHGGGGGGG